MRIIFEDKIDGERLELKSVVEIFPSEMNKGSLTCVDKTGSTWTRPMENLIGIYMR